MVLFPGDCWRLPRYPLKKLPPTAIVFIGYDCSLYQQGECSPGILFLWLDIGPWAPSRNSVFVKPRKRTLITHKLGCSKLNGLRSLSILIGQGESLVWWSWGVSTPPEDDDDEVYPPPLNITLLVGEDAGREWFDASDLRSEERRRSPATPKPWSSSECMAQWGMAELQREPDPRGYLVFTEGREQLGNNRFLLSDGLVIAKALNRTLVEFPMANSRIVTPHAELGFCDYWDCSVMCSYHRILDLETFRSFLREGFLTVDDFISVVSADWEQRLLPALETAEDINDFFFMCRDSKVIELRMAWKSRLRREPMALITPNPFYLGLVGRLLAEQKGWGNGRFLAVQWRTETSRGDLSECYTRYVAPAIEGFLHFLNLRRDQVFFNVDLIGQASTTYNASVVRTNQIVLEKFQADYPVGMNNTVYNFLREEQDAGVKAMITGLVSASSGYLLSSSFNASTSNICQKPHSKYIDLVAEWRLDLLGKDPLSMGELFPVFDEPPTFTLPLTLVLFAAGLVLCVMMWAAQTRARDRLKSS